MDYTGTYYHSRRALCVRACRTTTAHHALVVASLWEVPVGKGRKFGTGYRRPVDLADRRLADERHL